MNDKRKSDNSSFYQAMSLIGQVGFYIALPTVLGALLGQYVDGVLRDSTPFATIFGLLFGLAVGVALVVRAVSRLPQ